MKKTSVIIVTALALVGLFFAFKTTEKSEWLLDKPHAKLSFTVGHLMVSDVEGWFKEFDAKITTEKDNFSDAVATMTAQIGSINTDNDKRDMDLKSSSYFDAAKYPILTFKSSTFTKVDDQNYKVIGDMTIHGITQRVELNALCKMGISPATKKAVAGFKVTGTIKRLDFGIGTSTTTALIGNEITIVANVEFWESQLP